MTTALLKFAQDGGATGGDGEAFVYDTAVGSYVSIGNSAGGGTISSWRIELLYAPPGSPTEQAVGGPQPDSPELLAENGNDSTPAFDITPDSGYYGCYRIRLTVWSGTSFTGTSDVDIRNIGVPTPNSKFIIPPYQDLPEPLPILGSGEPGEKPDEMNFDGQVYGWDGGEGSATHRQLSAALLLLDNPTVAGGSDGEAAFSDSGTLGFASGTKIVRTGTTQDGLNFGTGITPAAQDTLLMPNSGYLVGESTTPGTGIYLIAADSSNRVAVGDSSRTTMLYGDDLQSYLTSGGFSFIAFYGSGSGLAYGFGGGGGYNLMQIFQSGGTLADRYVTFQHSHLKVYNYIESGTSGPFSATGNIRIDEDWDLMGHFGGSPGTDFLVLGVDDAGAIEIGDSNATGLQAYATGGISISALGGSGSLSLSSGDTALLFATTTLTLYSGGAVAMVMDANSSATWPPSAGDVLAYNGGGYVEWIEPSFVSYGTDNQIPVTNATGDGFEYGSTLIFDGTYLHANGVVIGNDRIYFPSTATDPDIYQQSPLTNANGNDLTLQTQYISVNSGGPFTAGNLRLIAGYVSADTGAGTSSGGKIEMLVGRYQDTSVLTLLSLGEDLNGEYLSFGSGTVATGGSFRVGTTWTLTGRDSGASSGTLFGWSSDDLTLGNSSLVDSIDYRASDASDTHQFYSGANLIATFDYGGSPRLLFADPDPNDVWITIPEHAGGAPARGLYIYGQPGGYAQNTGPVYISSGTTSSGGSLGNLHFQRGGTDNIVLTGNQMQLSVVNNVVMAMPAGASFDWLISPGRNGQGAHLYFYAQSSLDGNPGGDLKFVSGGGTPGGDVQFQVGGQPGEDFVFSVVSGVHTFSLGLVGTPGDARLNSLNGDLYFNVPSGDAHILEVNSVTAASIGGSTSSFYTGGNLSASFTSSGAYLYVNGSSVMDVLSTGVKLYYTSDANDYLQITTDGTSTVFTRVTNTTNTNAVLEASATAVTVGNSTDNDNLNLRVSAAGTLAAYAGSNTLFNITDTTASFYTGGNLGFVFANGIFYLYNASDANDYMRIASGDTSTVFYRATNGGSENAFLTANEDSVTIGEVTDNDTITLQVAAAGTIYHKNGTYQMHTMIATGHTLYASDLAQVTINSSGLQVVNSGDLTDYLQLSSGGTTSLLTRVTDGGTAHDFVTVDATTLTLGDSTNTATLSLYGGGALRLQLNSTGMGFFNTTPASQPSDIGALTLTTGTPDNTLVDVSGTSDDATINANFADVGDQINDIRSALRTLGLMA